MWRAKRPIVCEEPTADIYAKQMQTVNNYETPRNNDIKPAAPNRFTVMDCPSYVTVGFGKCIAMDANEMDSVEWIIIALASLSAGSTITMLVYRLPLMILRAEETAFNVSFPRSHCPQCRSPIQWRDNIPLLGWLLLKGKCRFCRRSISKRYPLTEAVTLSLSLIIAAHMPDFLHCLIALMFCWFLIALTLIDAEHYLLPDSLTQSLVWTGLVLSTTELQGWVTPAQAITGALVGYGSFRILSLAYLFIRKKEGLGGGDAKLMAALGAWLGVDALPGVVFIASITTLSGIIMARMAYSRNLSKSVPFGPALSFAGLSMLVITLAS